MTAFNTTSFEEEYSEGYRGFIDVFNKRATAFCRQVKLFELNKFLHNKNFHYMVKPGRTDSPCK